MTRQKCVDKIDSLIASRSIKRPGRLNGLFDIIACPVCMKSNLEGLGLENLELWVYQYESFLEIEKNGLYSCDFYQDCYESEPVETHESDLKCEYCSNLLPGWMYSSLEEWAFLGNDRTINRLNTVKKRDQAFIRNQFIF